MPVQISPSSSDSLQESKARERQKAHRSFLHLQHFVEHLVDERMRVLRDRHLGAFSEAPPGTNTTGPAYAAASGSNANFDTSMVIILAALLCALIFALGLNSIVRCALRCGRRLAFENPEEEAARLAATGLKRQALRRIPVAVYGEGADIPPATECPICLGEFADGENVRVLPKCHHGFHVRCIDKWLASHSSCPTCRRSLLEQGAGEGAEAIGQAVSRSGGGAGELALA